MPKNFKHLERGNAALVAMVILGTIALTTLTLLASSAFRNTRNLDKGYLKVTEKWEARSQVNKLAAVVSKDAPAQIETDVRFARENCNADFNLPIFDPDGVPGFPVSRPAVTFDGTTAKCVGSALPATSIFGKFDSWRDARLAVFKQTGVDRFSLNAAKVNIIEMTEIYRRKVRSGTTNDTAYAVRYIAEAQFGNYRTRTTGEIILGSSIPGCGTTVSLEIVPSTVVRGNPVVMNIAYTYTDSLQITDASGTLLHTEAVTQQSTSQTFLYTFTPAVSGSYRVIATGSGGCSAQSALVPVIVTDPAAVCPVILNFSASSGTVNAGQPVMISWNVTGAADVKLEDVPVAFVGSQIFAIYATRTFTLTARDAANTCPITQTVTVIVNQNPVCPAGTPQIGNFSANPSAVPPGGTSTLSWNVSGLATGGTVRLTGNGLNQSVNASGTQSVTLPNAVGNYTYTLIAENTCPDGTILTAQRQVVVSVLSCPPPAIDVFTVNPATVSMGGNQLITLAWSISGTVDAVSISNGVGSGLPSSGSVEITQPQTTTTYTITAVGCGQTRQMQKTVTVNTVCPIPIINSFTALPAVVSQGGNQNILFNWNTSGTIDSQSIDQSIGMVTGNSFSIIQPQSTTTYTFSVFGCGQSRQAQATVIVNNNPVVTCSSTGYALAYRFPITGFPQNGEYFFSGAFDLLSDGTIRVRTDQGIARVNGTAPNINFDVQILVHDFTTDAVLSDFRFSGNTNDSALIVGFPKIVVPSTPIVTTNRMWAEVRSTVGGRAYNNLWKFTQFGQPIYLFNCP